LRLLLESAMLLAVNNADVLSNKLLANLEYILPEGWGVYLTPGRSTGEPDGLLEVTSPSGNRTVFVVETKSRFEPRDIDYVEHKLERLNAFGSPLLVTTALSGRSRELLKERNFSYADDNGNIRLSSNLFFVEHESDTKREHTRGDLPRSSLRGPKTGRLVRYLLDARPPLKVRDIADVTAVNPGNVSRLLRLLDHDRLITRDDRGMVTAVEWEALIRQWSESLKKDRHYHSVLEPHGIQAFVGNLRARQHYAVTGSYGAALIAPAAHTSAIDVYVTSASQWIKELNLREAEGFGNIRLIDAFDKVAFERTIQRSGLIVANPSQVAADLLTLPKRSSDEYNTLIAWMKSNERAWRLA